MARRGLNNFIREKAWRNGQPSWALKTLDQEPVPAFDYFCEKNVDYAFATQKRYAEVASRFIDYLQEAGAFGQPISAAQLNAVIGALPTFLRDGSAVTTSRVRDSGSDLWLADVAERLDWAPVARSSFDNTIAPINRFLRLSESLSKEAHEKAAILGLDTSQGYNALIKAIDGLKSVHTREVAAMKQNSTFGNVAKFAHDGIKRPQGLRSPKKSTAPLGRPLDFPRESLSSLIDAAESWRDKALWLMEAALGVRSSEARNVLLDDIDFEAQKVYVFDPNGRRAQFGQNDPNRFRFKGRAMAYTYFIPELRDDFFHAVSQYLRNEFVPCSKPGEAAYLFQYVDPTKRGQPYVDASDAALADSFKRATRKANIAIPTGGRDWGQHSLCHMYGVYMVNDYPVDPAQGRFGLPLVDVQLMMGHAKLASTAHYARSKHQRLAEKLAASDRAMLAMSDEELRTLPSFHRAFLENCA